MKSVRWFSTRPLTACLAGALLTGTVVVVDTTPAAAAETAERASLRQFQAGAQALIDETRKAHDVEAVSVALVGPTGVLFSGGSGRIGQGGAFADGDTIYRIGSLTKLFTAAAFMQLVEDGRARLDAPITDYVPEFRVRYLDGANHQITPRDLMGHHAGLPGNRLSRMWSDPPESARDTLKKSAGQYAVPRRTIHAYSNLGTVLLGQAIENISGQSYEAYVRSEILAPLGMSQTDFQPTSAMKGRLASGYFDGKPLHELPLSPLAAGGLYSSVNDLAKFIRMNLAAAKTNGGRVLSPASVERMLSPQNADVALDLGAQIGLPWYLNQIPLPGATKTAHHTGGTLTFKSVLGLLPEQDLGVVVLTNSSKGEAITGEIAAKILGLAMQSGLGVTAAAKPANRPLPPLEAGACGDRYTNGISGFVQLSSENGATSLRWKGGQARLQSVAPGILETATGVPVRVGDATAQRLICTTVAGRDVLVAERGGQRNLIGEEIEPYPIPEGWRRRLGSYRVLNPDPQSLYSNFSLREEGGLLLLDFDMPYFENHDGPAVVKPISDTQLLILGLGRATGDVIELKQTPHGEALDYEGYLLQRDAQPTAASDGGRLHLPDGVWQSRGYGLLLAQNGRHLDAYQYDPVAGCTPIAAEPLRRELVRYESDTAHSLRIERSGAPGHITFDRISEVPQSCRIATKPAADAPSVLDSFCKAFDAHYAFFAERKVDWDTECRRSRAKLTPASSDGELSAELVRMINLLDDRHVRLVAGRNVHISGLGLFLEPVFKAFNQQDKETSYQPFLAQAIAPYKEAALRHNTGGTARFGANGKVAWGWARPGAGYLWIGGFTGFGPTAEASAGAQLAEFRAALDAAMADLRTAKQIVVDLRLASGGMDLAALELAGRFAPRPWLAMTKQARIGNGLTAPQWFYVTPTGAHQFTGPVALLVSNFTVSAAENFGMFMMNRPQPALVVGERTAGVHSDVLPWRLPNGWTITLSNEVFRAGDGVVYETHGLPPQIEIPYFVPESLAGAPDKAVLAALRGLGPVPAAQN